MVGSLSPVVALSRATAVGVLRAPAFAVGAFALVAALAALPALGSPAASSRENEALALELSFATLGAAVTLGAGGVAVRAAADLRSGRDDVLRAAPAPPTALLIGRAAGIAGAFIGFAGLVVGAVAALWAVSGTLPSVDDPRGLLLALAGILVTCVVFASLGLLLGVAVPPKPAFLLLLVAFLAARGLPAPDGESSLARRLVDAVVVPNRRVDLGREVAFGRPVGAVPFAFAAAAAFATVGATLLVAAWRLERGERSIGLS